jgi:hypothetical protein
MKTRSPGSFLPQALFFAVLVGPLIVLLEMNSTDRVEPNTPLARAFQNEIEAALSAANGAKVQTACSMHGNINFGVSCRVPAPAAENLVSHLLASGWGHADGATRDITLRKGNRYIAISHLESTNEVSIAIRMVTS